MSLHDKIINMPCETRQSIKGRDAIIAYRCGHRDARNMAAEISDSYDELLEVTLAMRDYIDALPKDLVLPAMPGFDMDWADDVVERCENEFKQ